MDVNVINGLTTERWQHQRSLGKMAATVHVFERVLASFPNKISYAFAYGSGIFLQEGQKDTKGNMMDFVFVVDNPSTWHKENLKQNRWHYSFLKYGGHRLISDIQQSYGAGIYFNTLIPFEDGLLKYGVISTKKLITDLLDWETLYMSGRLHKPIRVIRRPQSVSMEKALVINLNSALHTALLCLPDTFSEEELYMQIANLSYAGDFRMMIGEDKRKVQKIVQPQTRLFRDQYESILDSMPLVHWHKDKGTLEQDCSTASREHHLNLLPRSVQHKLLLDWNKDGRHRDVEDVMKAIAHEINCADFVMSAVSSIVWRSSWSQSLKGILTAGVFKSVQYGGKKLGKMITGMRTS